MITEANENAAMLLLGPHPELAAHGRAVARTAMQIAEVLGFSGREQVKLRVAAGLHDLGKLPIPAKTLAKPGPLDPDEWSQVRLHPVLGEQLLLSAGLDEIAPWVRSHHERPDGTGYPDGLCGDAIPLQSRIIAVADAFDAMVSDRAYSAALSERAAREEIVRATGTQFDHRVAATFLDLRPARQPWRRFRPAGALYAMA
jgi:HD-GYP domain-containing protein (c-di-GMP phosphodiesterase class II)